jgi:hypothetical protein
VPHIAFANITNEDCRQFTTRGSQHAFMLLQLAVEMLMRQNTELQTALCSARQAPPVQAPAPPPVSPEAAILRRDLEARNALIDNLTAQLDAAEHEKNSMIAETQSLRARIKKAVGGRGRGRDATPTWDDSTTPTRRPEADPSSESEDSSGWT